MFTGIIKATSTIEKVIPQGDSLQVDIKIPQSWQLHLGDSVAVNGVCSTVKNLAETNFEVEYIPETIKQTTVGNFQKGMVVNLEPSLTLQDAVSGHLVQGHIDTKGKIIAVKKPKEFVIEVPEEFMKFVTPKGSVAIDGISLTAVYTTKNSFSVCLINYTLENTNLSQLKVGDEVNIETDIIARYLYKLVPNQILCYSESSDEESSSSASDA